MPTLMVDEAEELCIIKTIGKSKSQKELIKDNNRDYTNENHWDLRSKALIPLIDFLCQNLG